jgi:AAA domain
MPVNLSTLQTWLKGRYQGIGLTLTADGASGQPLWHVEGGAKDKAQLFDSELGLWIQFHVLVDPAAASLCVEDAIRDGLEQVSRLDPKSSVPADREDALGLWQVHVVWLVTSAARVAWGTALAELRARSGHTEELGLDMVEVRDEKLDQALDEHDLPALLFRTRALMRLSKDDLPRWLSPDHAFEQALKQIPPSIANEQDRKHAQSFIDQVIDRHRAVAANEGAGMPTVPALTTLEATNFRIIGHGLRALTDPLGSPRHIDVIHGPNGTGKSSLFEALSLALFGTSRRLCEYMSDPDIKPADRGRYAELALRRFGFDGKAALKLGGVERLQSIADNKDEADDREAASRGTLLAQETAREFVTLNASQRAIAMLGDYSRLASRTQQELDSALAGATSAWQDTLRSLELNASIKKRETIHSRLARRLIDGKVPKASDTIEQWLKALESSRPEFKEEASKLMLRWARVDTSAGRDELSEKLGVRVLLLDEGQQTLLNWLAERRQACQAIDALATKVSEKLRPVEKEWGSIQADIEAWAAWTQAQRQRAAKPPTLASLDTTAPTSGADEEAQRKLADSLRELEATGKLLRGQFEHLQSTNTNLMPLWRERHPHDCPTCGQVHADDISHIITRALAECEDRLRAARESYNEQQAKLKAMRDLVSAANTPPISAERQAALAVLLGLPAQGMDSLSSRVESRPDEWRALIQPLVVLLAGPALPQALGDLEERSLVESLVSEFEKAVRVTEQMREAPDRWRELKLRVDKAAVAVLQRHLPDTIESVWREIAFAMAPARWNQPSSSRMKLDQQRGAARLALVVSDPNSKVELPARHVLNQAEGHVLGLAWFFTRHLTHGRFVTPLIALDDPAQEMDQSTFRRFVRFLQAFVRLHRNMKLPLTLIVFLHQEDRALELARSIDPMGQLTLLSWSPQMHLSGTKANARSIRLRNPEQRPPLPQLLQRPSAAATSAPVGSST